MVIVLTSLAFAQGTSIGTAVGVLPGGSASGSMDNNSRHHYWKVTTSANGYLRVEVNSSSAIDVDVTLYDQNGTTSVLYDGRYGTYSEVFGFLKPGTYYIYAMLWTGTAGTYALSTAFSSPTRSPDTEPNDTPATAQSLGVGATMTGHLGFTGNEATDTEDCWKITTAQDGWLRVQVRSDSLDLRGDVVLDFDAQLHDVDGTTSISYDGQTSTFSQVARFVRPGTYCVRVNRWGGRAGSYEIKSELLTPPLANDAEGNDTWQTASTVAINGSVTGHAGYYTNGITDTEDYWKYTVPGDGLVTITVVSDSLDRSGALLDLDITHYDVNGTTSIGSDGGYGPRSKVFSSLKPGTFYVRVYRWSGNAGSYTLSVTHQAPARANDTEANDTYTTPNTLTFNQTSTGHIGYYANGEEDTQDWWRITAPSADSLYVHVTSDSEVDLDLVLRASDGVTNLASDGGSGVRSLVGIKPTAGTTYYVRVNRWLGTAGTYSIVAQRSSLVSIVNGEKAAAIPLEPFLDQNYPNPFNPTTTIRFGMPQEGNVRLVVYSLLGQEVATLLDEQKPAGFYTVVWNAKNGQGMQLPSGTYLLRLQYSDKQFVRKVVLVR